MKNKLTIWAFALLLIAVLALPIAYAQSFTGTRLFFMLINAAVIGIVLFILQAVLMPGKGDKEKTSMWGIVIGVSLLIAFLYGQNGYIWEVGPLSYVFNIYALVNSLVIAVVLYFVLSFIPQLKLNSPEGKTGYGLLLLIIAVVIAVNFSPGRFIWSQDTVRGLVSYLFSGEAYTGEGARPGLAKGLLHPNGGLMVFIAGFVLLAFFFNNVLLKDQKGWLNYALALLFAFKFAAPPANPLRHIIMIGEIVFGWVFFESLQKTFTNKWLAFFVSLFLVTFASTTLTMTTPESRGFLGSMGCMFVDCKEMSAQAGPSAVSGIIGTLKTIGWWALGIFVALAALLIFGFSKASPTGKKWIGWGVGIGLILLILLLTSSLGIGIVGVILLALLVAITLIGWGIYAISRAEDRQILREAAIRIWAKILQRLRQNRLTARIVGDWLEMRDPTLPDELPFVFKDLRVEIYTLMNFLLRHEIYKAKAGTTHKIHHEIKDKEVILANRVPTKEYINENMKKYIEGGVITQIDPDGKWDIQADPNSQNANVGFGRTYHLVLKLMEQLKQELETEKLTDKYPDKDHWENVRNDAVNAWVSTDLEDLKKGVNSNVDRYASPVRRFRVVNLIEAQWYYFLDMYNLYGVYKRGYRFAKFGSKPDLYSYRIKADNGILREIDWDSVQKIGTATTAPNFEVDEHGHTTHFLVEVDTYGFSTSDINAIQIERKNLPHVRKWKFQDFTHLHKPKVDMPRFADVLELATKDWDWFIEDVEKGSYHLYTRRIDDYTKLISKGYMNFEAAKFENLINPQEHIGFDREGLKNPGEFVYWGRKNYYDDSRESLTKEPVNPYPTISMKGLWDFIGSVAVKRVREPDIAKKYLDLIKLNYREIERPAGQKGGASTHAEH